MDEDDIQHLEELMRHVAVLTAVVLTAAVLMVAAPLMAGCAVAIHVQAEPAQVKPDDMVGPPVAFTTLDGDSK